MSGDCCQARGEDSVLRLQCILPAGHDGWHEDGPDRGWKTIPNDEEER